MKKRNEILHLYQWLSHFHFPTPPHCGNSLEILTFPNLIYQLVARMSVLDSITFLTALEGNMHSSNMQTHEMLSF